MPPDVPISSQDRLEAAELIASSHGHVFEIQLGHLCNNRCVFCSSGFLTEQKLARPVALEPILEAIERAKREGARRLIFLGGEPTLHKGFLPALEQASKLEFQEIVIFTNGVLLPQPGFIDKVVALGSFEWRISIQGSNSEAHNAVTGRKQSFDRILRGLARLQELQQRVTANLCVNRRSLESLPGYPALVHRYGIRQLHVDIVRPSSVGERPEEYMVDIMPRYSEIAPWLDRMMQGFADSSVEVSIGNLPYCVIPQWSSVIFHGGEPTVTAASDLVGLEDDVDKYAWHASLRTKPPACAGCVMSEVCTGFFSDYRDLYGDEEIQPIRLKDMIQLPPQRRPFSALVRGLASNLLSAEQIPEPWALESRHDPVDTRSVSVTFSDGTGRVTLRITSPEVPQPDPQYEADGALTVAANPLARIALAVDRSIGAESLGKLLGWVHGSAPELQLENLGHRLDLEQLMDRGRARAGRLAQALRKQAPQVGWRWGSIRMPPKREVVLPVLGPGSHGLEMVFSLGARGGRSQVDVDFRLGETPEELAKPVIERIASRLGELRQRAGLK